MQRQEVPVYVKFSSFKHYNCFAKISKGKFVCPMTPNWPVWQNLSKGLLLWFKVDEGVALIPTYNKIKKKSHFSQETLVDPSFCMFLCGFAIFFLYFLPLVMEKVVLVSKHDFNQQITYGAPVCWLKYTTFKGTSLWIKQTYKPIYLG